MANPSPLPQQIATDLAAVMTAWQGCMSADQALMAAIMQLLLDVAASWPSGGSGPTPTPAPTPTPSPAPTPQPGMPPAVQGRHV